MLTIADIMTANVITLSPNDTLRDAHELTRTKGIRHLPVIDPVTQKLIAIVTQKAMIAKVINLLTLYGNEALVERERETNIMELAVVDFEPVSPNDEIATVANFFLQNKHGCLPVTNSDGGLEGIVTSSDFVKLSVRLLAERNN